MTHVETAALVLALAFASALFVATVVVLFLGLRVFAQAISAAANAELHRKQVAAFAADRESASESTDEAPRATLGRTNMTSLSEEELLAAVRATKGDDAKVRTFDENDGITEDIPPMGRTGVYRR